MKVKAHFITSLLFNREIKVVKIDKSALDYYTKLTELYAQFRSVGVNYNQIHNQIHNQINTENKRNQKQIIN